MVNYICLRCGYKTKIKTIFIKHLNRKFKCQPTNKDVSIEFIYNEYFGKNKKNITNEIKIDNIKEVSTNVNKMSTNVNKKRLQYPKKIYKT